MKASTLMQTDVGTCRPDDALAVAAQVMWDRDCGVVPVVDADRHVVGAVTDRDLCMAAYTKNRSLGELRVRDAMQAPVHCCRGNDRLPTVHALMRKHQVRRIPVIDADNRLVGIVSLNDLALDALAAPPDARTHVAIEVAETLGAICRHREPVAV